MHFLLVVVWLTLFWQVSSKKPVLNSKTKYFKLRWFDEECSENNEVDEIGERKRLESLERDEIDLS